MVYIVGHYDGGGKKFANAFWQTPNYAEAIDCCSMDANCEWTYDVESMRRDC